ncbi:MAG: hypothetical protein MHM6MM_003757 [Cercozoa sp. M6MM]
MASKDLPDVQVTVESREQWEDYLKFGGLLVCDVYSEFWGGCNILKQPIAQIQNDIQLQLNIEKGKEDTLPVRWLSVPVSKIERRQMEQRKKEAREKEMARDADALIRREFDENWRAQFRWIDQMKFSDDDDELSESDDDKLPHDEHGNELEDMFGRTRAQRRREREIRAAKRFEEQGNPLEVIGENGETREELRRERERREKSKELEERRADMLPLLEKYSGWHHPQPRFVFIKNRKIVDTMNGANLPRLQALIAKHLSFDLPGRLAQVGEQTFVGEEPTLSEPDQVSGKNVLAESEKAGKLPSEDSIPDNEANIDESSAPEAIAEVGAESAKSESKAIEKEEEKAKELDELETEERPEQDEREESNEQEVTEHSSEKESASAEPQQLDERSKSSEQSKEDEQPQREPTEQFEQVKQEAPVESRSTEVDNGMPIEKTREEKQTESSHGASGADEEPDESVNRQQKSVSASAEASASVETSTKPAE